MSSLDALALASLASRVEACGMEVSQVSFEKKRNFAFRFFVNSKFLQAEFQAFALTGLGEPILLSCNNVTQNREKLELVLLEKV